MHASATPPVEGQVTLTMSASHAANIQAALINTPWQYRQNSGITEAIQALGLAIRQAAR